MVDLDRASTAPLRSEARIAMEPFRTERSGNPSAAHRLGRDAVLAVDAAREQMADLLGCRPSEVVFTSGGTEADVHAVTGGLPARTGRVLCSAVEHPAVLRTVVALGGSTVAVHPDGRVDLDALRAGLDADRNGRDGCDTTGPVPIGLVSVMVANNELGTINDIPAVAAAVAEHAPGVPLHTDAVQAAPWLDLRHLTAPAALVSVSAHKFGGPKGVGALVARAGTRLRPLLHGGGQEWGLRSGTTNVAGVVGMAAALAAVAADRDRDVARVASLRDRLAAHLCSLPGVERTVSTDAPTLPGFLHVLVDDVDSEPMLFLLDAEGVMASASSACASGAAVASHVLDAIGVGTDPTSRPRGALRFSLGHDTTLEDVDRAVDSTRRVLDRLRVDGARASVAGA